jgi:hypothetical protein
MLYWLSCLVIEYTAETIYLYLVEKLWAAYSAAAACTLMSIIIGIFAIIVSNQTSYSNDCSTSLLIARAAEQIEEVRSKDTDGKSPLLQYLAKATILLAGDNKIEIEDSDTRTKNNNRPVNNLNNTN